LIHTWVSAHGGLGADPQARAELRRQLEARCEAVARRPDFQPSGVILSEDREPLDTQAPESADVEFNLDPDRRGITLVSPNPNLRLTGLRHQTGAVVIKFGIPSGYLAVARFRGRHYLRNGYHRVAGLVRAGVTTVPAVVTEVEAFENMVMGGGGFGGEVVGWRVPPVMTDFWDETVSIDSAHPVRRTGFHIRADEIRLPA
jgi:hypothetical protein